MSTVVPVRTSADTAEGFKSAARDAYACVKPKAMPVGATCSREFASEPREAAKLYGLQPLTSDDNLEIEAKLAALQPEWLLDKCMERHVSKRALSGTWATPTTQKPRQPRSRRSGPQMRRRGIERSPSSCAARHAATPTDTYKSIAYR